MTIIAGFDGDATARLAKVFLQETDIAGMKFE